MINFPDDVKERQQRMQIHYHIGIIRDYANPLIAGWYIEEAVYAGMYGADLDSPYYDNYNAQQSYEAQVAEVHLPDIVLIHMTASDDTIRERMKSDPHRYQIIKDGDIPEIKLRFDEEVDKSLFAQTRRKIVLDTTGKPPEQSFVELLRLSKPLITFGELAMRSLPLPVHDYDVQYENGVRRMILK